MARTTIDHEREALQSAEIDFTQLFAADLEEVIIPMGDTGSWIKLRPMDSGAAFRAAAMPDNEKAAMEMLLNTVVDYCFVKQKRNSEGELITEEESTEHLNQSQKKRLMQDRFPKLLPKVVEWIVKQCLLVNGHEEDQAKN